MYFQKTLPNLLSQLPGLNKTFYNLLKCKYELATKSKFFLDTLPVFSTVYRREILKSLNILFSQIHSVNNLMLELRRLNIVRLYLARLNRGKSHAIGRPTRGQRTWSNAWTSYKSNKILRNFIGFTKRFSERTKIKKINYKLTSKKYLPPAKKKTKVFVKKKIWF